MIALEIKSYGHAYKRILAFLLVGIAMGAVLQLGIVALTARGSLFEPFTIGVVDEDGTPELVFLFDFFNEYVMDLALLDSAQAHEQLAAGEIPAFIELPHNFTSDVFTGINNPFLVHVNSGFPLQSNLTQLLATGGIAFLSASQAGVYSTLEYAAAHGLDHQNILIPVNMAFVQALMRYDELFTREMVTLVEGNPADYFINRFIIFWHMLSLIALVGLLPGYASGILARFRLAGMSLWQIDLVKWAGLFTIVAFMSLPVMPLIGIMNALLASLFVSAFGMLSGQLFKHEGACGLFIFFIALVMYFASGGIVPFVFLPRVLLPMRWISINYLVANGHIAIILISSFALLMLMEVIKWFSFGSGLKVRAR